MGQAVCFLAIEDNSLRPYTSKTSESAFVWTEAAEVSRFLLFVPVGAGYKYSYSLTHLKQTILTHTVHTGSQSYNGDSASSINALLFVTYLLPYRQVFYSPTRRIQ